RALHSFRAAAASCLPAPRLASAVAAALLLSATINPADAQRPGGPPPRPAAAPETPPVPPGPFPMPDTTKRMHIVPGDRQGPSAFPMTHYEIGRAHV